MHILPKFFRDNEFKFHMPDKLRTVFPKTTHVSQTDAALGQEEGVGRQRRQRDYTYFGFIKWEAIEKYAKPNQIKIKHVNVKESQTLILEDEPPSQTPADLNAKILAAIHGNDIDAIGDLLDQKDTLGDALKQALHTHDAKRKIPAAYAKTPEMVDALVKLGTNINYCRMIVGEGHSVSPPYGHSDNEKVAQAWLTYGPKTDVAQLLKQPQHFGGAPVSHLNMLMTVPSIKVFCAPPTTTHAGGPIDPTKPATGVENGRTVLHFQDKADIAQAYIDVILAREGGEDALKQLFRCNFRTTDKISVRPLSSVGSYEVAKVYLDAGAPVDEKILLEFKQFNTPDVKCKRYNETLKLLTEAFNKNNPKKTDVIEITDVRNEPQTPADLNAKILAAIRGNDMGTIGDLLKKKDTLGDALKQALHTHDADRKIPAAYADTPEMVDALVELGTNINHFVLDPAMINNVLPPWVHPDKPAVALAWRKHKPMTDAGQIMGAATANSGLTVSMAQLFTGSSPAVLKWFKTKESIDVFCEPNGGLVDPTKTGRRYQDGETALHHLADPDIAKAYIRQILAHDPSGGKLQKIFNSMTRKEAHKMHALSSARSYGVVEVFLKAGARVDEQIIKDFKENNARTIKCERYEETLELLNKAYEKQKAQTS